MKTTNHLDAEGKPFLDDCGNVVRDIHVLRWMVSRRRKAALASPAIDQTAAQSSTTHRVASASAASVVRTQEQQAAIDRRKLLSQACSDAVASGLGRVSPEQADELAANLGVEEATKLIQRFGQSAFFEAMASEYWKTR